MFQTFTPTGDTVLVDTTARQVKTANGGAVNATSYRIVNIGSAYAYISWAAPKSDGTVPTITVTAPVAGTNSANTMGMPPGGVETFYVGTSGPLGMFFKASAGASFEVTPGDGL
jgi:hypothetical protein